jgi:hypothetical protein
MSPEKLIEKVIGKVLSKAANDREDAGRGGEMGDRGASTAELAVRYFRYGWNKQMPPEWKDYIPAVEHEADPEWAEFQRLSQKFSR